MITFRIIIWPSSIYMSSRFHASLNSKFVFSFVFELFCFQKVRLAKFVPLFQPTSNNLPGWNRAPAPCFPSPGRRHRVAKQPWWSCDDKGIVARWHWWIFQARRRTVFCETLGTWILLENVSVCYWYFCWKFFQYFVSRFCLDVFYLNLFVMFWLKEILTKIYQNDLTWLI